MYSKTPYSSTFSEKISPQLKREAEQINRSLTTICELSGKRQVSWLRSDGRVGQLGLISRICIWIASLFKKGDKALRYFASYDRSLPTMLALSGRIEKLSLSQPKLVENYWKAWRVFSNQFHIVADEYTQGFNTPGKALIRGTRSKEDINTLLDCYSAHYSSTQLIQDFASEGLLAQALWVIEVKGLDFESLKSVLKPDDYAWMELQRDFKASPSTHLDAMALNGHDGKLGLGWGYKSANLTRLQATAAQVSRQCDVCDVDVPAFFPIGDTEMQRFIRKGYPDLDKDWNLFLNTFPVGKKIAFLSDLASAIELNDAGKILLKKIREKIAEQFTGATYITPQIEQWLDQQKPQFVIVRSTGKEDSATSSNAGGNASIPYVKPKAEDISAAMGEVLASYFGEKSILQRLAAHDTSIFEEAPFMPVLIQDMVSENVGGVGTSSDEVPRSGVMFTQSEGKATGLTELYVGLGNNEGIVSSRVNTDHYLLDQHGGIAKAVHTKDSRFVAIDHGNGHYGCEPIANSDPLLTESPALPDIVARDMKTVADYFSRQYGEGAEAASLDMEFTIKMSEHGGRPKICLLQARPLVNVAKEHEPSYLDTSKLNKTDAELQRGKTLLDGGSYVREISSSSEILVCETITEALDIYLQSPNQKQIKTVIILKPAPGTSHEAVTFRARGVGALIVEDPAAFALVQNRLQQVSTTHLLVDLQRGIIAAKPQSHQAIHQGYACYPMPLEYSMTPSRMISNLYNKLEHPKLQDPEFEEETKKLVTDFNHRLHSLIEKCQGSSELLPTRGKDDYTLHELLEVMAGGNSQEVKLAAATVLHVMRVQLNNPKSHLTGSSRLELMMIIENMTDIVEKQVLPAALFPAKSLDRLYPVRLLEACLFQPSSQVRGAFSYMQCMSTEKNQQSLLKIGQKLFGSQVSVHNMLLRAPFFKITKAMLKPENATAWESVIKHLPSIDPSIEAQVKELFISMDQLSSLTEWSNVEISKLIKKHGITYQASQSQAKAIFNELAALAKQAQGELNECREIQQKMITLHQQMGAWENPDHVKKQAANLLVSFQKMGFTYSDALSNRYKACPRSVRIVLLKTWIEAVRTYDEVIKTCKSSSQYSDDKAHASDIHLLLTQYRSMMLALLKTANAENLYTKMGDPTSSYGTMPVATYIERADYGANYTFGFNIPKSTPGFLKLDPKKADVTACSKMLLPSAEFNVAMAVVGNQSDYKFSTIWPVTLEDYFTFFHQNMEVCVSGLRTQCGFSKDLLPGDLESYCSKLINKVAPYGKKSILSSISCEGSIIQVAIDIPLRQHAAKLLISYDRSLTPPSIKTRIEMFGNPEHNRWELTAGASALIGTDLPGVRLVGKPEVDFKSPKSAAFEVETRGMDNLQADALTKFLADLGTYSMTSYSAKQYILSVNTLRKAFHGAETAVTAQNLSQGGFYMSMVLVEEAIAKKEYVRASTILAHIGDLIDAQPHLKTLSVPNSYSKTLGDAHQALSLKCAPFLPTILPAQAAPPPIIPVHFPPSQAAIAAGGATESGGILSTIKSAGQKVSDWTSSLFGGL